MKNLKPILLLAWLILGSFSNASFSQTFVPIMVGDITVMIPIGPIQESEESSETLPGKDNDNDGVRDDVQKNIVAKYGINSPIATQSLDIARKYQKILSGNLTAQQINQQIADAEHLNACIQNEGTEADGLAFVVPKQLNTVARTRAYLTAARDAYHESGPPAFKDCGNSGSRKAQQKRYKPLSYRALVGGSRKAQRKASRKINVPNLKDYDVYFINGVDNTEKEGKETKDKLKEILNKHPAALLYNKNHFLVELFDLWVHKAGEIIVDRNGTLRFWGFIYDVLPPDTALTNALFEWYDPNRDVGYWAEKNLEEMIGRIKGSLNNKKKVIAIPHSEGNFFYRNIWQELDRWDSEKTQQCFAGIGFAPPLSSKPGSFDYITNSNDKVINAVRAGWGSTLNANVTVPNGYGDFLGHGMLKTYLAHSAPLGRFETELNQAVAQLDKSCDTKKCADPVGKHGGQGKYKYTYALKDTSAHTVEISFEAYSVPDQIRITANGKTIAQTDGYVSGFHQWQINYDPKKHGTEFIAHVDAQNNGTAWNLCIDCEGSSCGGQIQRKKVSYSFQGTDSHQRWTCSNYRIDGSTVDQSGTKMLSVGEHRFSADCSCKWGTPPSLCKPFFGFPYIKIWSSSASCGTREECGLNNKRNVMVDVY